MLRLAYGWTFTNVSIGEIVSVKCSSTKATAMFWTTVKGERVPHKRCKTCNVECSEPMNDPMTGALSTTLTLTPYVDEDFGVYECRGHVLGQTITLESITISNSNNNKKDKKCQQSLIRSEYLVELQENPPLCDSEGNYKRIQLKHLYGDNYLYYCADMHTGAIIGKEATTFKKLPCVGSRVSFGTCLAVLFGVELALVLLDLGLFWKWEQGVLAHIFRRTKRQQYVRVNAYD